MRHVKLGRTGLTVSRLCLGTMTFGLQCDEGMSHKILDRALAGGITFIDTSDVYPLGGGLDTAGQTEEIIGRWLPGRRADVILATKGFGATGPRPWDRGNSRKHLLDAIDASLRRLGTDYVDLYQLHHPDDTPIDESLRALDDIVRAGKARYVGCSNFFAWQVARALGRSELLRLARFDCVQPRYNLLFRQIERELLPLCQEEGLGVIPYNPLAGGLLTGKHRREAGPTAGHAIYAGQRRPPLPGALLARPRVRHRGRAPAAGQGGRTVADPARDGVGAGESRDHGPHRGRQPPGAARRRATRGGNDAWRRSAGAARSAHARVSPGRRHPLGRRLRSEVIRGGQPGRAAVRLEMLEVAQLEQCARISSGMRCAFSVPSSLIRA